MIDKYNMEALENIYNIDAFASHYDFIVPKLEKVKVQTNKKTKPRVQSVCRRPQKERILKTKDMEQYKREWYMHNKKKENERSKLWRINHPERYRELMKRHIDKYNCINLINNSDVRGII